MTRTFGGTLALVALVAACTRPAVAPAPPASGTRDQASMSLTRLRAATQAYRSIDSAAAAGYNRNVADCLVHEHHGAMGYHHSNSKFADATVDIEHPEILLYERKPDGEYKLNGVEFIVPYRAWSRDSVAPTVMGQRLKHEDNLKIWYLHVWAWSENANGVFADFNPSVQCPDSARKVFKPYEQQARP
jgi:hypothetical protein